MDNEKQHIKSKTNDHKWPCWESRSHVIEWRWKVIPNTLNTTAKADLDVTMILRWKNHMLKIILKENKKQEDRWVGVLLTPLNTVKKPPNHSSY